MQCSGSGPQKRKAQAFGTGPLMRPSGRPIAVGRRSTAIAYLPPNPSCAKLKQTTSASNRKPYIKLCPGGGCGKKGGQSGGFIDRLAKCTSFAGTGAKGLQAGGLCTRVVRWYHILHLQHCACVASTRLLPAASSTCSPTRGVRFRGCPHHLFCEDSGTPSELFTESQTSYLLDPRE